MDCVKQRLKIPRHKTAISRPKLSLPARRILEAQLIGPEDTYLDYGCGRGDDVRHLKNLGISASGWDPYWQPKPLPTPADFVACLYVINVIEDLQEREEALRKAWDLTGKALVVAARVDKPSGKGTPFGDGVVTSIGTFQHFYTRKSLQRYIEQVLRKEPQALAPGVFLLER
jgi:DNA phosphorothioation-associated putative methyltransferase